MKIYCYNDSDNGYYDISFELDQFANLLDNAVNGVATLVSYKYMTDDETPTEVSVVNAPAVVKVFLYYPETSDPCLLVGIEDSNGNTMLTAVVNMGNDSIPLPYDPTKKPSFTGTYQYYVSGELTSEKRIVDEKFTFPTETSTGVRVVRDGSRVVLVVPNTVTP